MIKVKLLSPDAKVPTRATQGSAGWDLSASEDCIIEPRSSASVGTGLAFEIPQGWFGMITNRSSLAFKLECVSNLGIIDCDYRGEVKLFFFNHSDDHIFIKAGDRVAQIVFMECYQGHQLELVESLASTSRTGGFGSTNSA